MWFTNVAKTNPRVLSGIEPGTDAQRWSYDLRTVACVPAHSEDNAVQYPAEESNPVLQIRNLPCRPSHSRGIFQ